MCGAGELPALMASEARRRGWRVVAFAFAADTPAAVHATRVVPAQIGAIGAVVAALQEEKIAGVLLSGKFWMGDVVRVQGVDAATRAMEAQAARTGGALEDNVRTILLGTLASLGIELLDQRPFLGAGLPGDAVLGAHVPTPEQWDDVRLGLRVARAAAALRVGQSVVVRRGAVSAVEAIEGTTAAIRRGTELSGRGAVVAKAVAADHDFRFDVPTVGPETIEAAAQGGAAVVAIEAERVFVLERAATVRRADEAGIALVSTRAAGD
jgi:DUF1009 family protein